MAWKYNPKNADQAIEPGDYEATIASVTEKTSKSSGMPMLEVVFTVYAGDSERKVWDYIVDPGTLWKLKRLAKVFDRLKDFELGTFDLHDYIGHNLTLTLAIDKNDSDKNQVKEYSTMARTALAPVAAAPASTGLRGRRVAENERIEDKDIPF